MSTGEKLRKLRGSKTQREVARDLSLSVSAYNQYETGKRTPSDENKRKIAQYYGRTVQFLFFE